MRIHLTLLAAAVVGSTIEVGAQDLNLSNRLEMLQPSIAKSLELNSISGPDAPAGAASNVVCDLTPEKVYKLSRDDLATIIHSTPPLAHLRRGTWEQTVQSLLDPKHREVAKRDLSILLNTDPLVAQVIGPINTDLCQKIRQPTTVKLSMSFNPQYETNALKSPTNIHEDHTTGLGSQILIATGGFRVFDIMAVSAGTASSRYDKFTNKSVDAVSLQAVYQFFLGSFGYKGGIPFPITENTSKSDILPGGLVTFDTFAVAIQNQASYTPTFQTRTADLLTPQIQLTRSNISLLGADKSNECSTTEDAYKKHAFCYFADVYLNVGQAFSDVKTQENTNVAASIALGRRIDKTNWKVTMQVALTEKIYDNVVGGRRDLLLQTGSTVSYTHPAVMTPAGNVSMAFNLPVTYSDNRSSLAAAEWRGWVVMPTLTLAFTPK